MHSLVRINIQHDYNKNYKIPSGVYMILLQQKELYQISTEMDVDTMSHAMYFTGNKDTATKINHIPYQTI